MAGLRAHQTRAFTPGFDDLRNGSRRSRASRNYEVGYRIQTETFYGVHRWLRKYSAACPSSSLTGGGQTITAGTAPNHWCQCRSTVEPNQTPDFDLSGDLAACPVCPHIRPRRLYLQPRGFAVPPDPGSSCRWTSPVRFFMTYHSCGLPLRDPSTTGPSLLTTRWTPVSSLDPATTFEGALQGVI